MRERASGRMMDAGERMLPECVSHRCAGTVMKPLYSSYIGVVYLKVSVSGLGDAS